MAYTYYAENKLLNFLFGASSIAAPSNWYVGLSKTYPGKAGTYVIEPVGNGYQRAVVPNVKTELGFSTSTIGSLTNSAAIVFPEATGIWGDITYAVFYDAAEAGNLWFYGLFASPQWVGKYAVMSFNASELLFDYSIRE